MNFLVINGNRNTSKALDNANKILSQNEPLNFVVAPNSFLIWSIQIIIAIPFINPEMTTLGMYVMNLPSLRIPNIIKKTAIKKMVMFTKWSGLAKGALLKISSCENATKTAVTAVIGPVGPEHWILVPPSSDVIEAIMAAEIMPVKAPLPESIPNAAPKLKATKLTVKAAITF